MIYPNTQGASQRIGKQGSSLFETNQRNAVDAQRISTPQIWKGHRLDTRFGSSGRRRKRGRDQVGLDKPRGSSCTGATSERGKMASRNCRIVCDENFVLATRDAGYRSLASAIAELLDNSIQAGAKCIRIFLSGEDDRCTQIAVLDDGSGMNAEGLQRALQFGGTSRFNDRSGYGRFGMGLPNSSFSQARRVEVYTWQSPRN